jgi:CelD/BcsL family acetyltransferase involved in cellulose biosynthesis
MTVVVRTGNDALDFISSLSFMTGWKALMQNCAWATACQHPDFIIPWYQIYKDRGSAVVVTEQDEDGAVIGIFPLALINGRKRLVGAGMVEAEYQCWVERPENDNRFIRKAIDAVRKAFPKATLHLRYISGGVPMDWIGSLASGNFYRLQKHARPLLDLSAPETAARLENRRYRAKINKLKKMGELTFERVENHQVFVASFDEVCAKYDSRQKEKNFVAPFQEDPLKGKFYMELHRRGILHATKLTAGDKLVAFHAGLISRNWLHLGINVQSSEFEKQSPGTIHLLMLSALLYKENFCMLDLTPGGDEYKETFATKHDVVFELFLFPGYFSFLENKIKLYTKDWTKTLFKRLNIRPALLQHIGARLGR